MDILEARYWPDPWKVLVNCIMLNRTRKVQVEPVIEDFFRRWPCPEAASNAEPGEVYEVIRRLGFGNVRSNTLVRFSQDVLEHGISPGTVRNLYGVGEYAADAYNVLFMGHDKVESGDYALSNFVRYQKEVFEQCPKCGAPLWSPECKGCDWVESPLYSYRRRSGKVHRRVS